MSREGHAPEPGVGITVTHRLSTSVTLLTEAGRSAGFGHLGRCCALYDAFARLGADPELIVRGDAPAHIVEGRLCRTAEWASPDAASAVLESAQAAVVDSYAADTATYSAIARAVTAVAYIDDGGRLEYPPGIIVNGSPAAIGRGPARGTGHELLLGPANQPLRRPFWDVPARPAPRPALARVLVMFGGTDVHGLRAAALPALRTANPGVEFDVVDAPRSAAEIRDALLASDAAVTAAGQTLYELARTGTPAVCVCVADNQIEQASAWQERGVVRVAGTWRDERVPEALAEGLAAIADPAVRARMAEAGPALVDGMGALRVARALLGRVLDERIRLAPATAPDEHAVLELANDPVVRSNSLNTEPISPERHHAWFADRLAHPESTMILLAWDGETLAGTARFDIAGDVAVVSVAVAGPYRGSGWSRHLLDRAIDRLRMTAPTVTTLSALVRADNTASRRLFQRAGFEQVPQSGAGPSPDRAVEYRRMASAE